MASVAIWRAAGMTYTTYSNLTANIIRNCLKEPHKTQVLSLSSENENVQYLLPRWIDSTSGKLTIHTDIPEASTRFRKPPRAHGHA